MKHVIEISFLVKGFIIFLFILSACILLDTCSTKHKSNALYSAELQKSGMVQSIASFHFSH
jgi:hypothetical protein